MALKFGLIGKNGSGKSTVCQYLKDKGFTVISLSDYVREKVKSLGLEPSRDNLVNTANALKAEKGQTALAEMAYERYVSLGGQDIVFDSIRNIPEIEYLKSKGVVICGIEADIEKRFNRITERQHGTDNVDLDTFKQHDQRENSGESSGQQINAALALAEIQINNEGNLDALYEQIDEKLLRVRNGELKNA